jgi:predicted nucleotidyltransferase
MTSAATAELIQQRLADLSRVMPDLRLLVLFGSLARGRARSESDIHVAVQCDGPADLDALYLAMAHGSEQIVWT